MLKIRQLIKRVRACKTAEEERSVINKESAEIRNLSKDPNAPNKARNLCKAIYMQMMGYQTSFMQLSCINLLASPDFTEKRIAYSALPLVIDTTSQVLLLATSTIKKDLQNKDNPEIQALALNAIGDVCTADMCRELSTEVASIIKNSDDSNVKKRAACAAVVIIKNCPEFIDSYVDKIPILFEDRTHSVCLSGIYLVLEMINNKPEIIEKIKKFHEMFVKYEKSLLSVSYSPEFDVNGITDPFLQAKILEIMQYTAKDDKELIDELGDLFVSVQSITEASKQTGYALQYEIIKTINNLNASAGMKSLSNNILGKFLSSSDYNLKYIALNTLKDVARKDLASVQKHRALILDFLKDSDISLQKRALDLIYLIINKNNLKTITRECLKFLPKATDEIKFELTKKLEDSICKYAISFKWEIDNLIKMVINSNGKLYEDVLSKIINEILKVKDLYIYSSHKAFITLKNMKENNASLTKLCYYLIGELSLFLVNNTTLNSRNEVIKISEDDIINLLKSTGEKNYSLGNDTVVEYLLNTLVKLLMKFPSKSQEIQSIIKKYNRSYFAEVQSRALEYLQFYKSNKNDMKNKMVESVPIPKKKEGETDYDVNRELTDEKDDDNIEPDDEIFVVRLKEGPIKTFQNNNNDDATNNLGNTNNNPLDFLGQTDNNINQNNDQNKLDLLDLNNIFSGGNSTTDNNNSNTVNLLDINLGGDTNNTNNNNNANNSSPFDLLNLQLNQISNDSNKNNPAQNPNVANNNNNSNQISDLFGMMPTNNNNNSQQNSDMEECFKNEDITLHYKIAKKEGSVIEGSIFASNNSNEQITDVKINFLVQKFVKCTVLGTSGFVLEPSQALGIKKDFTLTSNDASKKVILKIKLHYILKNEEKTKDITIKNL